MVQGASLDRLTDQGSCPASRRCTTMHRASYAFPPITSGVRYEAMLQHCPALQDAVYIAIAQTSITCQLEADWWK